MENTDFIFTKHDDGFEILSDDLQHPIKIDTKNQKSEDAILTPIQTNKKRGIYLAFLAVIIFPKYPLSPVQRRTPFYKSPNRWGERGLRYKARGQRHRKSFLRL